MKTSDLNRFRNIINEAVEKSVKTGSPEFMSGIRISNISSNSTKILQDIHNKINELNREYVRIQTLKNDPEAYKEYAAHIDVVEETIVDGSKKLGQMLDDMVAQEYRESVSESLADDKASVLTLCTEHIVTLEKIKKNILLVGSQDQIQKITEILTNTLDLVMLAHLKTKNDNIVESVNSDKAKMEIMIKRCEDGIRHLESIKNTIENDQIPVDANLRDLKEKILDAVTELSLIRLSLMN